MDEWLLLTPLQSATDLGLPPPGAPGIVRGMGELPISAHLELGGVREGAVGRKVSEVLRGAQQDNKEGEKGIRRKRGLRKRGPRKRGPRKRGPRKRGPRKRGPRKRGLRKRGLRKRGLRKRPLIAEASKGA